MDDELDIALAYTSFTTANGFIGFISPQWSMYKGFASDGTWGSALGSGALNSAQSTTTYVGQQPPCAIMPPPTNQRWGDYMSMIWDSSVSENPFWTVNELTTSGSDEQTHWDQLVEPTTPFFVGYSQAIEGDVHHQTCTNSYHSTTTVQPPPNIANGDTLVVILEAGVPTIFTVPTTPPGWTLLPMANIGGNSLLINQGCGSFAYGWIAVHQYSASDSRPYSFTQQITPAQNVCGGGGCFGGELGGFLVAYRGAISDANQYLAYGYANSYPNSSKTSSTLAQNIAASRELVTIFQGDGNDPDENKVCDTFGTIAGSPMLTPETPATPTCANWSFYAADQWSGSAGGAFGPYSVTPSGVSVYGQAALPAFQVVLPPQSPP
jgi:hypothetical protein